MTMTQKMRRPKGLMVLAGFQIFMAARGAWNFFHHTDPKWEFAAIFYFALAIFCGAIGYGLLNLKRWAYRSFVVVYVVYIVQYVGNAIIGSVLPELTLSKYRMENIKGAIICLAVLGWGYYYRRFFHSPAQKKVGQGQQPHQPGAD